MIGKMKTSEKIIKSKERVKNFAEVYTPSFIVKEMCDMLDKENDFQAFSIDKTFLEPACGNGNFLVEILERKLKECKNEKDGLKALNSIFGIDIQADNVEESRERLLKIFTEKFPQASVVCMCIAHKILTQNIICADSLAMQKQLANGIEWGDLDKTLKYDFKLKKVVKNENSSNL